MRRLFRFSHSPALVFVLFAASTAFSAEPVPAPPKPGQPIGVLMSYVGRVRYWGKLVRGPVSIVEGSFIETEKDANCSVLLGREVVVHIGPESRLEFQAAQIAELKRAQLNFPYGKGRFLVRSLDPKRADSQQRFDLRVRSRAAVLGVRGTQFVIDAPRDPNEPQAFVTIEGKVAVDAVRLPAKAELPPPSDRAVVLEKGQSAVLEKKEGTRGEASTPPRPVPTTLSKEEVNEVILAIVPPSKPLLLAGQVGDSLLPREEPPSGSAPQTRPTDGKQGTPDGAAPPDPFDPPPPSPFKFDAWGSGANLDGILPTDLQGGLGIDPVADLVESGPGTIDLTVEGEKQGNGP